jgi:branched-chain amino acid transport system permease protein
VKKPSQITPGQPLAGAGSFKLLELLPWAAAAAVYFLLPDYLSLATQVVIMIMFALSLDLLLGYTGIVTLGHAAFFGTGAYAAGILAHYGWSEPISGLAIGMAAGAFVGFLSGIVILRTRGLALLMLGMALTLILHEAANHFSEITGGADGLQGIVIDPIFGRFEFDLFGKTGFVYAVVTLVVVWIFARQLVRAPFGRSLVGIRENPKRMAAIGVPVDRRRVAIFTIAAAIAGLAGALSAQTNQFVGLNVLGFELSGTVLVILVLGGPGRLYGAFLGAPIYYVAQDAFAKNDPVFWLFWLGLLLVCIVMFARGGLFGIADSLRDSILRIGLRNRLSREKAS